MRPLTVSCCVCFLLLTITTQWVPATSGSTHGCAPLVPPPVPGPLVLPLPTPGALFINEILLQSRTSWTCPPGPVYSNPAWVEIYNAQNQALDLYAAHASLDCGPGTAVFKFPIGSAIAAHGFLTLFPTSNSFFSGIKNSILRLLIQGISVDTVTIPPVPPEQSYARIPDGGNQWQITTHPTIDSSNTGTTPPSPPGGAGGNGASGNSGSGGSPGSTTATQPAWSNMHFPTPTPAASTVVATSTSVVQITAVNSTNTATSPTDIPRKILLTVLVIAFGLTLLWCWRQFRSP